MFKILEFFGSDRNPYAPIIYKMLTFSLIENYENLILREFLLKNFIYTLKSFP